jgi:tetratricopeptide (TPR) repeat protein
MKTIFVVVVLFSVVSLTDAQDKLPVEPVASVETTVEADFIKKTGDPRGLNDESDVTGLVLELQKKEAQLQRALNEVARLRSWIEKIKTSSQSEKSTMHYNMGCMYKLYKEYSKAEQEFLKALAISPEDPNIHYNLGILYDDDLDNNEAAATHYGHFLELSANEQDRAQVQEWLSSL